MTLDAFDNFHYHKVASEYRSQKVTLKDLNEIGKYVVHEIIDRDLHLTQVRLAARLFDPDAFIFGSALLKAHDNVIATLSTKNLVCRPRCTAPAPHPSAGATRRGTTPATARCR